MNPNITLRTVRTLEIDAPLRAEIVNLCTTAHLNDFGSLFTFLPADELHILAFYSERLVSHAVVTTRKLEPENLPLLKTAYLDAVSTDPQYQGQGIGSAVMGLLAAQLADYDMACLETDRISFYSCIGWQEWRGPLVVRKGEALELTPEQKGIMVLRLARTPPLDLDSTLTVVYDGRAW